MPKLKRKSRDQRNREQKVRRKVKLSKLSTTLTTLTSNDLTCQVNDPSISISHQNPELKDIYNSWSQRSNDDYGYGSEEFFLDLINNESDSDSETWSEFGDRILDTRPPTVDDQGGRCENSPRILHSNRSVDQVAQGKNEINQKDASDGKTVKISKGSKVKKSYICSTCSKSFQQSSNLSRHMMVHTGEKPFKCKICPKSFSRFDTFKLHNRVHTENRPKYTCEFCGKNILSRQSLEEHTRIHTGEKPFKCQICEKTFTSKKFLTVHKQRIHDGTYPKYIKVGVNTIGESNPYININLNCIKIENQMTDCENNFEDIQNINSTFWQPIVTLNHSIEEDSIDVECVDRFDKKLKRNLKRKSKAETLEMKATRREKKRIAQALWRARAREKNANNKLKGMMDKNSEKYKKHKKWDKKTSEEKKKSLARIKNFTKSRKYAKKSTKNSDQNKEKISPDSFCELCQRHFYFPSAFNLHNKYIHPEIYKNPAYLCQQCGRSFNLQIHLDNHILFIHNQVPLRKVAEQIAETATDDHNKLPSDYLCEQCGKELRSKSGFNLHTKRHAKILAMRKETHENKIRLENPSKSDQEIEEILKRFWESEEWSSVITKRESKEETKAVNRLNILDKITRCRLQKPGESKEQCLKRLDKEKVEKMTLELKAETEDVRANKLERRRINWSLWVARNKEKRKLYQKDYWSKNVHSYYKMDKKSEEYQQYLASQRDKYAKLTPEKKARMKERMKNYDANKRQNKKNL